MELLESIPVERNGVQRRIEVWHGDLTQLGTGPRFDYLVVSAFPHNYAPTPDSLVGALHRSGVSIEALSQSKDQDLRQTFACWMAHSPELEQLGYQRLLCFEPLVRGTPPQVVGDIFGAINAAVLGDNREVTVAMPLVASGNQGWPAEDMMAPLVEAALHWMGMGLPLERLAIVERHPGKARRLAEILRSYDPGVTTGTDHRIPSPPSEPEMLREHPHPEVGGYDAFISYSHRNTEHVDQLVALLKARDPQLRLFVDRHELSTGVAWLERIVEALDQCRKVVAIFTPDYFLSSACKAELNTAVLRDHQSDEPILFPIYLLTGQIPTFYLARQYFDCREADVARLEEAATQLASVLA